MEFCWAPGRSAGWGIGVGVVGRTVFSGPGRTGGGKGRERCCERVEESKADWEDGWFWEGWAGLGAGVEAAGLTWQGGPGVGTEAEGAGS